jgi:hypothetical protein
MQFQLLKRTSLIESFASLRLCAFAGNLPGPLLSHCPEPNFFPQRRKDAKQDRAPEPKFVS